MALTVVFSLVLGVPLGIISAIRANTPLDWLARFVGVLWLSVPSFYTATLAIVFGLLWFGWTPPQFGLGYVSPFEDPLTNLEEFFLPALILAFGSAGFIMRLTRSSMLEVMRNDYIRTAWAKGLRERSVVWRHAMKNALMPVLTVIGLEIGGLIGGAVIMESIFGLQGVGMYILTAVITRDILVVQTMALLFAAVYVLLNLLVDVGYAWLDPRIRYT
jgi:peptide/nickel transport system permease protein